MSPAGKIIKIDAFKKKESGIKPPSGKPGGNSKNQLVYSRTAFTFTLVLVAALSVTVLMIPKGRAFKVPPIDSIAPHNIKAPEDMLVEDRESTEKNRQQARDAVLDIYDFDDEAIKSISTRIRDAFSLLTFAYNTQASQAYADVLSYMDSVDGEGKRAPISSDPADAAILEQRYYKARESVMKFEQSDAFAKLELEFLAKLRIELDRSDMQIIRSYHYKAQIGEIVTAILSPIYSKGVIARKNHLPTSSTKGITLHNLISGDDRVVRNFEEIYDEQEAHKAMREEVARIVNASRPALRKLVISIAQQFIKHNITFNKKETDLRREKAAMEAQPVFFKIQRGEMIVREGELINAAHIVKLQALASKQQNRGTATAFFGLLMMNVLLLMMAVLFLRKFHDDIKHSRKLQLLLVLLLLGHLGLLWASVQVSGILSPQTPGVDLQTYMLAAPLAFGPLIVSIFFRAGLTALFAVIAAIMTGMLLKDYPILAFITMMDGMLCAYQVRTFHKRSAVLKAGIYVAIFNVFIVFAFDMIASRIGYDGQSTRLALAALGGTLSAVFVSAALPIVESLFPVVSDIKLLELANLNHPLLRRLIMEAPGTYHHSMMVGNLAEEACKAVGANALLARAGALFHDIGKMKKPEYFVENQRIGHNIHDKLTPYMSTLVVVNHIKEGQELAKHYKLLPQIAAMIPEHHGTQLVRFFYHKAKESEDATRSEVKEEDFRYPGPIPSSRESAIVALADSTEAAARACTEPTPARLRLLVKDVINDKFIQGQLDNSHLTLRDLALIADSFVRGLTAIHHHRIQYPEARERDRTGEHANPNPQTTEKKDAARA